MGAEIAAAVQGSMLPCTAMVTTTLCRHTQSSGHSHRSRNSAVSRTLRSASSLYLGARGPENRSVISALANCPSLVRDRDSHGLEVNGQALSCTEYVCANDTIARCT